VALVVLGWATALLSAANERERQARGRAEDNFQLARKAVDRFYTEVSESVLLNEPGMDPVRKKLLGMAQEFYEEFARQAGDDPRVQAELAWTYWRLATITRLTAGEGQEKDSSAKAIGLYQKAQTIFARLAAAHPEEPTYRHGLARTYYRLGEASLTAGDRDQAQAVYEAARELQQVLAAANPAERVYRSDLGWTCSGLGIVHFEAGRLRTAEQLYRQALEIRTGLVAEDPTNPQDRRAEATSHLNLGLLYLEPAVANEDQAKRHLGLAVQILEQVSREHPAVKSYRHDLASAYHGVGLGYLRRRGLPEARAAYEKALVLRRQLTSENPTVLEYRHDLALTLKDLALCQPIPDRTDTARDLFAESQSILRKLADDHPAVARYRVDLARSYAEAGDWWDKEAQQPERAREALRQALAVREQLRRDHPESVESVIELGTSYCQLGDLAARSHAADAAGWYARAVEVLRPLVAPDAPRTNERRIALWRLVAALKARHEYRAARETCAALIAWDETPIRDAWRVERAVVLAHLGDSRRAVEEVQAVLQDPATTPEVLFNAACAYSVAMEAVGKDNGLTANDRSQLLDDYARRAVDLLARFAQSGRLPNARELIAKINGEPELGAVRRHARYASFLKQLPGEAAR
jgi:tetratricopeptide (TPR) repeat protein